MRRTIVCIVLLATGCSGGSDAACEQVSTEMLDDIGMGLTASGDAYLTDGQAVQVEGQTDWFVAAELQAAGLEDAGDVTVWHVGGDPTIGSSGPIEPANGLADEFSDWGDAGEFVDLMDHPQAQAAEGCLG